LTSSYAAYFDSCPTYVLSSELLFTKFNQTWLCDEVKISGYAVMPNFPVGNGAEIFDYLPFLSLQPIPTSLGLNGFCYCCLGLALLARASPSFLEA